MYIFIGNDDVLTDSVSVRESASLQIPDSVAVSLSTVPELGIEPASTQQILDVGEIYASASSLAEFTKAMQSLTAAQKYALLTKHKVPFKTHVFPSQYLGGCNRSFRYVWLEENPCLVYSDHVDGIFCIFCSIFCKDTSKGYIVSKPFCVWNKRSEKTKEHVSSAYHQECMELADNFKLTVEHPDATITARYDAYVVANIKHNQSILKFLASAVLFCGRQCITLQGDTEKIDASGNPGNFLTLLKLLATHDDVLKDHLQALAMQNATYISPKIQNDLINVMAKQIFDNIVGEVNVSPYYSIMADEVTSHNIEHLSVCVRFLDQQKKYQRRTFSISAFRKNHR